MNTSTKRMAYTGLMMALSFIGTFIIKIPISSTGGYIHLGDGFVMLSGIILGPVYGALAAGIGSALADVVSGYAVWALPTLITKGAMAFIVGYAYLKRDSKYMNTILTFSYIILWSGFILLVRSLYTTSTDSLTGEHPFFDMITELLNPKNSDRLMIVIISMAIPLILVVLYKVVSMTQKKEISLTLNISYVVAGSLMVVLYYITEVVLYGSLYLPIISIPLNIMQFMVGIIIVNLIKPVNKYVKLD
ncbi:MAG: ECF transporter S component [Vallitaleaceae bacterium]|jgi:uncharacterized membrane protein|nr:ECF transporter S component [Vallitaleaceae bacterium]